MTYIPNKSYNVDYAERVIADTYSDTVSVDTKLKTLLKFGKNPNVGTATTGYTIWYTGQDQAHETYVSRNLIDSISSASSSDTGIVTVEGHTVGSDVSVSTLTQSAGTATCTTGSAHGYASDDWVYMEGANEAGYNGIVQITVTGSTTFTYTVDSGTASPATGTITATNQAKTFVTQDVTLTGQTRAALGTALARCTRVYVKEQNRATDLVGGVFVYENTSLTSGKPTDTTKIYLTVQPGKNQSEKASTSLSSTDYWILTSFRASVFDKTGGTIDCALQIRRPGSVFREVEDVVATADNNGIFKFNPFLIVPKDSDVRLVATAAATGTEATGSIQGYLAEVV